MNAAFFDAVRPMFGGSLSQQQVDGLNIIIETWTREGGMDDRKLAYILATAKHETASTMQPVRETLAKTDAKAKERLTKAWKAGKLKVSRDYWSGGYFGRGYVQLTHRENYHKAGEMLGLDLVGDPSKAMIPEIAALILIRGMMGGWFTARRLTDYIAGPMADYVGARRVVNGLDRAADIAGYAVEFHDALAAGRKAAQPAPQPQERPKPPPKPAEKPSARPDRDMGRGRGIAGLLIFIAVAIAGVVTGAWSWLSSLFGG